jgi:hypothetical protein
MSRWLGWTVLAASVMATCTLGAAPRKDDDAKLDKKVLEIVKQVGDLHKNAKSLHVEAKVVATADRNGEKRELKATVTYDIEQPNRIAMHAHNEIEKDAGVDFVSDGKNLIMNAVRFKQYTEEKAPEDLTALGQTLLRVGQQNTGMLFQNVLASDPYEQLMDGVTACSYAGKEKVGDTEAHHLKFVQEGLVWEMWVAATGKPFVLKMTSTRSVDGDGDGGKFSAVETYHHWKLDDAPAKDIFAFTPPKDAKKVDEIMPPSKKDE